MTDYSEMHEGDTVTVQVIFTRKGKDLVYEVQGPIWVDAVGEPCVINYTLKMENVNVIEHTPKPPRWSEDDVLMLKIEDGLGVFTFARSMAGMHWTSLDAEDYSLTTEEIIKTYDADKIKIYAVAAS